MKENSVIVPIRCKRLLDYLKKHCNGKDNIKTFSEIAKDFLPTLENEEIIAKDEYTHSRFKKDIQLIRLSFNTFICSTCKGYYVPLNNEEISCYMTNQALTHIKTCLAQGVSPKIFYDALHNDTFNDVLDGQRKLKISKYASEEVERYANK